MSNHRFFIILILLLAAGLALTGTASAQTPSPTPFVFVSSHTNIRNGLLIPTCATEMDPITASDYPFAGAECQLKEGGIVPLVTWNCFNTPSAVCTPFATVPVDGGAFYGISTTHDLTLVSHLGGCVVNGQIVDCYEDYLNYAATLGPPFPPQTLIDNGNIFPRLGVQSITAQFLMIPTSSLGSRKKPFFKPHSLIQ